MKTFFSKANQDFVNNLNQESPFFKSCFLASSKSRRLMSSRTTKIELYNTRRKTREKKCRQIRQIMLLANFFKTGPARKLLEGYVFLVVA